MSLKTAWAWWQQRNGWEQCAIAVWIVVILAVCGRGWIQPRKNSVYPIYTLAALHWQQGEDLYVLIEGYDYFRYSPLTAILFVPVRALPEALGGALWRLINAGVFLGALAWWARVGLPLSLTRTQRAWLFLLVVPVSIGSLNNAQSNALVIGLLLAAMACAVRERWNLAAMCLAVAFFFKLYPLAVGLLLAAMYPRRLGPRMLVALGVGLLLPFVFQQPPYVAGQYRSWMRYLLADDRLSEATSALAVSDVTLLLRAWLAPISRQAYLLLELSAGTAIAVLCLAAKRSGWPMLRLLPLVLGLGCCWMTAFGPATESCTYILLGPSLAWALLQAWLDKQPRWARALLVTCFGLLLLSQLANWFPLLKVVRHLGASPLAALLLLACLVILAIRDIKIVRPSMTAQLGSASV